MRHGETEWNRAGRMQGARDSPLTERGRAQAMTMGRALGALGVGPATHDAFTSPQGRAVDTARLALGPLGLAALPEPGLREVGMGGWAGLSLPEIVRRWPGPPQEALFDFYDRCPGGETVAGVAARGAALLASLRRPAVLVTHGITLRVLCALALGRPAAAGAAFDFAQGSIVLVRGGRLEVVEPPRAALPEPPPGANPAGTGG